MPFRRLHRLERLALDLCNLDLTAADLQSKVSGLQHEAAQIMIMPVPTTRDVVLARARDRAKTANLQRGERTARRVQPILKRLRRAGIHTYEGMAQALNDLGIEAPRAKGWTKSSVRAVANRIIPSNIQH